MEPGAVKGCTLSLTFAKAGTVGGGIETGASAPGIEVTAPIFGVSDEPRRPSAQGGLRCFGLLRERQA
mgnify:CR=1 FL=1